MVGEGGASSKLKRAARKLFHNCCVSSPIPHGPHTHLDLHSLDSSPPPPLPSISSTLPNSSQKSRKIINYSDSDNISAAPEDDYSLTTSSKNLCTICLDPLSYSTGTSPSQAIFTAQCSHAFHFACIASNVRHGGVTCPICRAQWTHLPRNLNTPPCSSLYGNQTDDPILQILDDSIATFRVHRRSFLRSARYDDDDPIEPNTTANHPRLHVSLSYEPHCHPSCHSLMDQTIGRNMCHLCESSSLHLNSSSSLVAGSSNRPYLSVKLSHQPATDLVLVASPNGPHLRLIKQSMALVVFSLRPIDRLAIVTYSSAAARIFPLRRMTSYGKRAALQVIDRLFYMGQADPIEGLKKGVKVLGDRAHENPQSGILHLSDCPTRSYHGFDTEAPVPVHRFNVGFSSFGTSNGFVMHEFEEFLARVLGDAIRDIQLRVGEDARVVRLGELRGGEERRIPLNMSEPGQISVEYSYVEGGSDECIRTGRVIVGSGDKRERSDGMGTGAAVTVSTGGGRSSNAGAGSWDYHDPYMARRWAKHLHGYRL